MKKLTIVVIISFDKIPISNLGVYFDFKHFFAVTKVCLDFVNESQPLYAIILERVPLNFDKLEFNCFVTFRPWILWFLLTKRKQSHYVKNVKEIIF